MDSRFSTRRLTIEDAPEIRKLLLLYFDEEVTSKCLQLSATEKEAFMDTYVEFVVPQGVSVGVFDLKSNEMCGCVFATEWNKFLHPGSYETGKHTPSLNKTIEFDEFMLEDMPRIVNNRTYLHLEVIIVNPKFQRQGLGVHLMQSFEDIALEKKFEMVVGVANTNKSVQLMKKMGFHLHNYVLYSEYKDPATGEAIFQNIPPPDTGAVFCYKVMSSKRGG
uniref:Uncharacterized protein LOC108950041 n=1 Tax=Phallusia mammillata TaxID=59560 RepID=A0A6F9DII9_9ASCI|nr:uncharacterized protein LOC108950041 [Phallusia mammillata]